MDLFTPILSKEKLHPIFMMLLANNNQPERDVLNAWANNFVDRDNKFVQEFQTSFESSMWELYIHAALREIGANVNFSKPSPDFNASQNGIDFCIEATIAAPPHGGQAAFGKGKPDIMPEGQEIFNSESTIRICNRISSKYKKYNKSYKNMSHVKEKPYIIALAPFDRPLSYLSANIPILAALYGMYHDEELTIKQDSNNLICIPVDAVMKNENTPIELGYFTNDKHSDISAIVYSPVATWGKIRALANKNDASIFQTLHPGTGDSLEPRKEVKMKSEYKEHLLDGLYIFHNPFAKIPLPLEIFNHRSIAQYYVDAKRNTQIDMSPDFLLSRLVMNPASQDEIKKYLSQYNKRSV